MQPSHAPEGHAPRQFWRLTGRKQWRTSLFAQRRREKSFISDSLRSDPHVQELTGK